MSAADTLAAIIRREGAVTFDVVHGRRALRRRRRVLRSRTRCRPPRTGLRHRARDRTAVRCVRRARARRLVAGPRRARSVPRRRSRCRLGPARARDPAGRAGLPPGPALRARRTVGGAARRSSASSSRSSRPTRRSGRSSTATSTRSSSRYAARVRCSRRLPTSRSCRPAASCSPTSCSTTSASGSPHWDGTRWQEVRITTDGSEFGEVLVPADRCRCARAATRRRRARGADRCPPPDTARDRGLGRRMRRRVAERDRRGARLHRRRRRGAATR